MRGAGPMPCGGFLIGATFACVLVDGTGSRLWRAVQCPGVSFGVPLVLGWVWAACLLTYRVVFLFCWRTGMGHPALELASSWVELGLSVGMEASGWALIY